MDGGAGAPTALRLAAALAPVWSTWLSLGEACGWLDALLARLPAPTATRARALFWAGRLHNYRGDYAPASAALEEAQALSGRWAIRLASQTPCTSAG